MNHIYRIIWNETLGTWVAVAENVKRKGKTSSKLALGGVVLVALSGVAETHADGEIKKYEGDGRSITSNSYSNTISLKNDHKLTMNAIGVVAEGKNGKNGRTGVLFVPPKAGGAGSSIGGEIEYAFESIYDNKSENGVDPLRVKFITESQLNALGYTGADLSDPSKLAAIQAKANVYKVVTFTPLDKDDNGYYADEEFPEYRIKEEFIKPEGTTDSPAYTAAVSINYDAISNAPTAIVIDSGGYQGLEIKIAGGTAVEPGSGFSSGVDTLVEGNGHRISITSPVGDYDKIAVKSINKGGDGGNGGKYILGGKGKPGGKGGDASDTELTVYNLNIDIGHPDKKINDSTAILAESIGGKGGNGGGSYTIAANGGSGNAGGAGANAIIKVDNTKIKIWGDNASGIAAISSGGTGGHGGASGGIIAHGGRGDQAGVAGDVDITVTNSQITIDGNHSTGILAQSVAGAGGNSGKSIGVASIGGQGGSGGDAGRAAVNSAANITMTGTGSSAIVAQSIGGGGGNGGLTAAVLSLGATGGAGGNSGKVSVTNKGVLSTAGDYAHGISAQSIGGGGGNAGKAFGLVGIGGDGKGAGKGADVIVNNEHGADISTNGLDAYGIVAQSIGGGGGNSGWTAGVFAIGGNGGKGNDASVVTVNNFANIETGSKNNKNNESMGSTAILAQSIGGGGGNGSMATAAGLSFSLAMGGKGAQGGNADQVKVKVGGNNGQKTVLSTWGTNSSAITAQSIGGGGGNGGMAIAANTGIIGASVSLGGEAGKGGKSGAVDVNTSADTIIHTHGDRSTAITAQSIGGSGGDGGMSIAAEYTAGWGASISLGGKGAKGGQSDQVSILNQAKIITEGTDSTGLLAQSIGGSGGSGGLAVAAAAGAVNATFALGGNGDEGGKSADVIINNAGDIETLGESSSAIVSQSIGGSGGHAGGAAAVSAGAVSVAVALGAESGVGGEAAQAKVSSMGNLKTTGNNATAIIAQSIGGAGGNAGFSLAGTASGIAGAGISLGGKAEKGGKAGDVEVQLSSALDKNLTVEEQQANKYVILTQGDNSSGVLAQSIGGSGGNAGTAIAINANANITGGGAFGIALGDQGGQGGTAGKVNVVSDHHIITKGQNASAIVAQSVGGSGGNGGTSVAATASASLKGAVTATIAIGGAAGAGVAANTVTVKNSGHIITQGDHSKGIVAQSIGGNGGNGGTALAGSLTLSPTASVALSSSVSGDGGTSGLSKQVSVENEGDIITDGDFSSGILAQSILGNGGAAGVSGALSAAVSGDKAFSATVSLGGKGGSVTQGAQLDNNVRVNNTNSHLQTKGHFSDGISAQAIGGNGGHAGITLGAALSGGLNLAGGVAVGVGGEGGDGGVGGKVTVNNSHSSIVTMGNSSNGINAQSIGGSGGNGGLSIAGSIAIAKDTALGLSASVGGKAGKGNASSAVEVTSQNQDLIEQSSSFLDYLKDPEQHQYLSSIYTEGNSSNGILAQAIGGGGGNGGLAGSFALAGSLDKALTAAVALGGSGNTGGTGAIVKVNSTDNITTIGQDSNAILAQSIGGGGGNAGSAVNGVLSAGLGMNGGSYGVNVSLGGQGGEGNRADQVRVESNGTLVTQGHSSNGVLAQSIGGGGGNGGMSISANVGLSPKSSLQAGVSIGGNGGIGGAAGDVNVTRGTVGDIFTFGDQSTGITAQSIGGGGGNGGAAIALSGALLNAKALNFSLGGKGGNANTAGQVNVKNQSNIYTSGVQSQAIKAQSIGGGGGSGGSAVSAGLTALTLESSTNITAAVGGWGGSGNKGNKVDVNNSASLFTQGAGSQGILAQSIGGGGGQGANSYAGTLNTGGSFKAEASATTITAAVGGFGGDGNSSGEVDVTSTGEFIVTQGEFASAIQAQSIGGGGGNGGNAKSQTFSLECGDFCGDDPDDKAKSDTNISMSVGGFGGDGNKGNKVSVNNSSTLITTKDGSNGIYAQSIGGGGGDGGNALVDAKTLNISNGETAKHSITLAVGGYKGTAANADTVDIVHTGDIATLGINAKGILAQSIGGGGGNGGNASGATVGIGGGAFQEEIASGIKEIAKLFGETVDTSNMTGSAGHGSTVNIITKQNPLSEAINRIVTEGARSDAIFAQSIGGGGGIGGSATAKLVVGGGGGASGNAGQVNINNALILKTAGEYARGIFAQSIGGGGGAGGDAGGTEEKKALVAIGGAGNSAGNGGVINITNSAVIMTSGYGSEGILAQSIGGGGGTGGSVEQATVAIGGGALENILSKLGVPVTTANGGNGGAITIDNVIGADIFTQKADSAAIVAQSIAGGGGIGGNATGTLSLGGFGSAAGQSGEVKVSNHANLWTEGLNSAAIIAQSIGGGGGIGGNASSALAIGGFAGAAGQSGKVSIDNHGQVKTAEDHSTALLAQSIAGGGGVGGHASGKVAIGGFGASGSNSDSVKVNNAGNLFTLGVNASAIVAQSISGGGGKGGSSDGGIKQTSDNKTIIESAYIAVGGNGASAGDAGEVIVNNTAEVISTEGDYAKGIVAQSIAGGGGMGGVANAIDVSDLIDDAHHTVLSNFDKGAAAVGLGNGAIYTVHNLSNTLAASIGIGADRLIGVISEPLENYFKNLANNGGVDGGSSALVDVINAKNSVIVTKGSASEAMVAQSISGGGGTTGSAQGIVVAGAHQGGSGNAAHVHAINKGILVSEGENSATIVAQSISGGGGLSSGLEHISSFTLLGGTGDTGSSAAVNVENEHLLLTKGKLSSAIIAQSIAGGGGITGLTHQLKLGNQLALDQRGDPAQSGTVDVINKGNLITQGEGSSAIIAQSIGGGGGYVAGVVDAYDDLAGSNQHAFGDANNVTVKNLAKAFTTANTTTQGNDVQSNSATDDKNTDAEQYNSIVTQGNYAHGIIAQSIAGGGGYSNLLDADGHVVGFFAGTVGGTGKAGNVLVDNESHIFARGAGSFGILAQSAGSENGKISIDLAKDSIIVGGTGSGAALALYDGTANEVKNQGYLTGTGTQKAYYLNDNNQLVEVGYLNANAIVGSNSSNTIDNDGGFITGNMSLPGGSSTLNNSNNGWVLTGQLIQLSNEQNAGPLYTQLRSTTETGQVNNKANWSVASVDEVGDTHVVGDFNQTASGKLYWDYNFDRNSATELHHNRNGTASANPSIGSYDTMTVTGAAVLDGTVAVNIMNAGLVTPGLFDLNFISANALSLNKDLKLVYLPSAISKYNLVTHGDHLNVAADYNFVQAGLTDNVLSMADALNRIQTVQDSPNFVAIAEAIYYQPDLAALQRTYDSLSGEGTAAIIQSALTLGNNSLNDISTQMDFWRSKSNLAKSNSSSTLTCSQTDPSGSLRADVKDCQDNNQWRLWLAGNNGHQNLYGKSKDGIADVKGNTYRTIIGLDYELSDSVLIGAAFVDGKTDFNVADRAASGLVESTGVTLYAMKDFDRYYLKGMVGYDWLKADTNRVAFIQGTNAPITPVADIQNHLAADFKGNMLNARIESGYTFDFSAVNITPFVGAQFAMTKYDATTETAVAGEKDNLALTYGAKRNYSAPLFAGVQFDKNYQFSEGAIQPYARLSVNHDLSTDREMQASFISAPGYHFNIRGGEPQKTSLDLNVGFKMLSITNVSLFGQYNGKFSSSNTKTDHVTLGLEYTW